MKTQNDCLVFVAVVVLLFAPRVWSQGTAFTYQGRLTAGGDARQRPLRPQIRPLRRPSGGTQIGPALTNSPVSVSNGLFTVTLDFGAGVFAGSPRWLAISVRTNGSTGAFSTLGGRQPVTPSPYAIHAADAVTAASATSLSGPLLPRRWQVYPGAVTLNNATISSPGTGLGLTNVNACGAGRTGRLEFLADRGNNIIGTHFVGTLTIQPLEFKVNNTRALRLEPTAEGPPNVIAGGAGTRSQIWLRGGGVANTLKVTPPTHRPTEGREHRHTSAALSTITGGSLTRS